MNERREERMNDAVPPQVSALTPQIIDADMPINSAGQIRLNQSDQRGISTAVVSLELCSRAAECGQMRI